MCLFHPWPLLKAEPLTEALLQAFLLLRGSKALSRFASWQHQAGNRADPLAETSLGSICYPLVNIQKAMENHHF